LVNLLIKMFFKKPFAAAAPLLAIASAIPLVFAATEVSQAPDAKANAATAASYSLNAPVSDPYKSPNDHSPAKEPYKPAGDHHPGEKSYKLDDYAPFLATRPHRSSSDYTLIHKPDHATYGDGPGEEGPIRLSPQDDSKKIPIFASIVPIIDKLIITPIKYDDIKAAPIEKHIPQAAPTPPPNKIILPVQTVTLTVTTTSDAPLVLPIETTRRATTTRGRIESTVTVTNTVVRGTDEPIEISATTRQYVYARDMIEQAILGFMALSVAMFFTL
jgi:hypothetical protein